MRNPLNLLLQKKRYGALEPDEIFIDAQNLPDFDRASMQGTLERPLSVHAFRGLLAAGGLIGFIFLGQTAWLDIGKHDYFVSWSEENRLRHDTLIAERGLILDRAGQTLAGNEQVGTTTPEAEVRRVYPLEEAAAQLVGYVSYPKRDQNGFWYQEETIGVAGAEQQFDQKLKGINGIEIAETDATGESVSGSVVRAAEAGGNVELSIDAGLQEALYSFIKTRADTAFVGGAGAVMDITTGELYALVSYPSFHPSVMSSGVPASEVQSYITDTRSPFLDRAVAGLYTPGSIVKPFLAAAALNEGVVTPQSTFVSTGQLVLPNPFDPSKPSIFKDWRAHGAVDMRRAIAVSSDVYFYIVGGGFESQRGLGVAAIDKYAARFGFGTNTGFPDSDEPKGTVPSPAWKAEHFDESIWRVGDTYNTSIGQYGWQVTLLQAVRATAALANGGVLVTPTIEKFGTIETEEVGIPDQYLSVAREGMRLAVTEGTAQSLSIPDFKVAGKTGTAEVGVKKEFSNSLVIGFFPYDRPKFAFAIILERSKAGTLVGAPAVGGELMRWIAQNRPELYTP
ncbi:MAG: penicillin-binding transpeptidase domain-containing protein [Patescibacteria group bacterium]|mgnify:CR=1 FL=1